MALPHYQILDFDESFVFFSQGPKGVILKVVQFEKIGDKEFILGFGDLNANGNLDDQVNLNNGDMDLVIHTVALITKDFLDKVPSAEVFIFGSTASRTRKYHIEISKNIKLWNELFTIEGLTNGKWLPFKKIKNFEAFLVKRKNTKFMHGEKS